MPWAEAGLRLRSTPVRSDLTMHKGGMKPTIRQVTPDLWPALEDLFGKSGASNGCWCMYWRLGRAYRDTASGENKEALRQIVRHGSPPGLLAFNGDLPVGWCQLTPRDALPWLDRMWWFQRVDDLPVWSISCFFRAQGLSPARDHDPARRRGGKDRKTGEGIGARGLSDRHERSEELVEYFCRHSRDLRARQLQGSPAARRLARSCATISRCYRGRALSRVKPRSSKVPRLQIAALAKGPTYNLHKIS